MKRLPTNVLDLLLTTTFRITFLMLPYIGMKCSRKWTSFFKPNEATFPSIFFHLYVPNTRKEPISFPAYFPQTKQSLEDRQSLEWNYSWLMVLLFIVHTSQVMEGSNLVYDTSICLQKHRTDSILYSSWFMWLQRIPIYIFVQQIPWPSFTQCSIPVDVYKLLHNLDWFGHTLKWGEERKSYLSNAK